MKAFHTNTMTKSEKLSLIHYLSNVTLKLQDLEESLNQIKDKVWQTMPSDDPFQTFIVGNLTEHEYIYYNKPQGFVWSPRSRMWIRHTGPCENCGWQPGDALPSPT